MTSKSRWRIALAAFCAAGVLILLYGYKGLFPLGNGSIMITDLYSQYVPLLYRFFDVVTGKKNLFLDFCVSGGADLYVDTINEVINPFNYVLLLFGRSRIYQAVNVILLLYAAAAAASACFFLEKLWPGKKNWNLVFSLCYALSGYTAYNYQIIKWMYFPVLFPLFVLALHRLFCHKKGGFYALLLGYQLILSVQLGFMTLLFTLFASGIWFVCAAQKEERPELMCRLSLYTLAGILLSCVVLVPNAEILLASSRALENSSYFGVMKQHGLDDLFERLFQIVHPVLLALGLGILMPRLLALRALTRGKVYKRAWREISENMRFWLLLTGLLWLTVLLQPANLLWHMGSYVCFPVRYGYMALLAQIGLLKCMLTGREKEEESEKEDVQREKEVQGGARASSEGNPGSFWRRAQVLLPVCAVLLCFAALFLTLLWEDRIVQAFSTLAISLVCPKETLQVCLILAMLTVAGLCAWFSGKEMSARKLLPVVTAACGVCFFTLQFLPPDLAIRQFNEAAYRKMTLQAEERAGEPSELALLRREKDDPELPLNAPLVNGAGSLSGYFPTASRSYKEAMEKLGYLVPWVATQSAGGTAVSDAVLSMGLVLEEKAETLQLQGESVLEWQAEMAQIVAGQPCLTRFAGEELSTDEEGNVSFWAEGRQYCYFDPRMTANTYRIYVNGEELAVPESSLAYSPSRIVTLGEFSGEEVVFCITDSNGTPLPVDGMELGLLDAAVWEAALAELENKTAEGALQMTPEQLSIDAAAGTIRVKLADAKEGETFFLPFAALDEWSAGRNGEEAEIVPVFGGFLGIPLKEGYNEIELKFVPRGLLFGLLLTLTGAMGLLACAVSGQRAKAGSSVSGTNCSKPQNAGAGKVTVMMSRLYTAVLGLGLLGIYVIPACGLVGYFIWKILVKVIM